VTFDAGWHALLDQARAAALRAHSPYSEFRVGAAVQDAEGGVFLGCNIESASFGLTLCAERVALYSAVAAGSTDLVRLAVSCLDAPVEPVERRMPCGACRQVMADLMNKGAAVMIDGVGVRALNDLLPEAFRLD
jgi:cytidine deaminase